jgi:hypothetical protein
MWYIMFKEKTSLTSHYGWLTQLLHCQLNAHNVRGNSLLEIKYL